jgi:glycosyltransferase involved in cell wall biosynthesis
MTFCIITHVSHGIENEEYFAYSPYVREMNIWAKRVQKMVIVAPLNLSKKTAIEVVYEHKNIDFRKVSKFNFLTIKSSITTLFLLPKISFEIYKAMKISDHIHLRCPGNMGLLGSIIQILFPKKQKTAKYAGNWDPKAKQPLSYKMQKWILSNTFLTKKIKVLVYGEWENSSKNIKPFFTATYHDVEKVTVLTRELKGVITFIFAGTLANGKNPLYAVKLIETLKSKGNNVQLLLFGEGSERKQIEKYIDEQQLSDYVICYGNQNQDVIKKAYQQSHFVILPSKSEGWPKVIAEGMFWGCLPISSKVSCVPNMLDNGKRGLLLNMIFDDDVKQIETLLKDNKSYQEKVCKAIDWSRNYTLDFFENEIEMILKP